MECFESIVENRLLVVKSNALIEGSFRLTLFEQRIILYAICMMRGDKQGMSTGRPVYLSAFDFSFQFSLDLNEVYRQMRSVSETLPLKSIYVNDEFGCVSWVSQVEIVPRRGGGILISFSPEIISHITRLSSRFTSYKISNVTRMTSTHAIRLYELLSQYKTIGNRKFELAELKVMMGLSVEYSKIADFRRNVVDIAVSQINKFSDLSVGYEWVRFRRTVKYLVFEIKLKDSKAA